MGQYQQNQTHQMVQNRARSSSTSCVRPVMGLSPSAWPTLQQSQQQQPQQPGSGMRAVFLGNPGGTKRECTGTGVFLPRTPTQTRKKPGPTSSLVLHYTYNSESVVYSLNGFITLCLKLCFHYFFPDYYYKYIIIIIIIKSNIWTVLVHT